MLFARIDPSIRAIGLVVVSGMLFVIMNTLVKANIERVDPIVLIWARYFFHVAVVMCFFPKTLLGVLRARQKALHVGRSTLLLVSTAANFVALAFMPLAEVASITFTSPILVTVLAVVILRERVSASRWLIVAMGFTGALLVVRPGASDFDWGAVFAFACALSYAAYQISTRIVREAEPLVSLLYGGLVGMLVLSTIVVFRWQPISLYDWLIFFVIGALGAIGHLMVILALQLAEASRVTPFTYIQLVWAVLASLLIFGEILSPLTLMGTAIIASCGLLIYRLNEKERRVLASPTPSR